MYSWGDDTSDWATPGTYAYSGSTKAAREEDAKKAKAHGPRTYTDKGGPNEQFTNPKKMITSQSKHPLIVGVDVTGSMQRWPAEIFDRLPLLYRDRDFDPFDQPIQILELLSQGRLVAVAVAGLGHVGDLVDTCETIKAGKAEADIEHQYRNGSDKGDEAAGSGQETRRGD